MKILAVLKSVDYLEPEYANERIVRKERCRLNIDLNFYDDNIMLQSTRHYSYEGSGYEKEKEAIQNFLLGKYADFKHSIFSIDKFDSYRDIVGIKPFFVDIDNYDLKIFFDDLLNEHNWEHLYLMEN